MEEITEKQLFDQVRKTAAHIARLSRYHNGHAPVKGEQAFLFYLYRHGKTKSGNLAPFLLAGTGRVANIARSLERKGYITHRKGEEDARVTYFSLTEKGEEKAAHIVSEWNRLISRLARRWGREKFRLYLQRTEEMADRIKERRKKKA